MTTPLFTLLFGLFLGIKHAFEADHMIAVTTMVTEQKDPKKAALIGTFWGIGHTTSLFVIGVFVLFLRINIPEKVSLTFELLIGFMLIFLGLRSILQSKRIHEHEHTHGDQAHSHLHSSHHPHRHHHRSFLIGSLHGLAGSGALMLLVLATIKNIQQGIFYILIFGFGSIVGMTIMSFIVGLPFIFSSNKFNNVEKWLRIGAGLLSLLFGIYMIYEIGIVQGLLVS